MKKLKLFLIVSIQFYSLILLGQSYAVFNIPDSLKEDADAVIRNYQMEVETYSPKKYIERKEIVVTVLNSAGDKLLIYPVHYSDSEKVLKMEGAIYDALGREIKKFKKKDITDVSAVPNIALYSDDRVKYFDVPVPNNYPYTFRLYIEKESENTIFMPSWRPFMAERTGVQQSSVTYKFNDEMPLRFKEEDFDYFSIEKDSSANIVSYSLENHPPIYEEELSKKRFGVYPKVLVSPINFQLEGVEGSFTSWDEFGKWYSDRILINLQELPKEEQSKIDELIKGVDDDREKARILYQYMQDRTRYILVSIGIGGWKPYPAEYVSQNGYGDCKALTNYMMSVLEYAGLNPIYTIVHADEKIDFDEEFPRMMGNHVILQVPLEDETVWLECTSQNAAFNYLGDFTDNRKVLAITPEGGKIMKTPSYSAEESIRKVITIADLDDKGNVEMKINTTSKGIQYGWYNFLNTGNEKQLDKYYRNKYKSFAQIEALSFDIENDKNDAIFKEEIDLKVSKFAKTYGNNMIIELIPIEQWENKTQLGENRKSNLFIKNGYTDEIEIQYITPEGYQLYEPFEPIKIDSKFGKYELTVSTNEKGLIVKRKLMKNEGEFDKALVEEYNRFINQLYKADRSKIIIEKR